jgi:hypothetical protein
VNEPGSSVPEKLNSFPYAGAVRKEPRNLKDGGRELIGGWDVGCGSPSELDRRAERTGSDREETGHDMGKFVFLAGMTPLQNSAST